MSFTPIVSVDDVDAPRLNQLGNELQGQIDDIVDGTTTITPTMSDFTDAQHDHSSAGEGGLIAESAISPAGGTPGQVLTVNPGGTASEWADTPTTALVDKGDLLTKNAGGDLINVPVGSDNQVLVADAAQTGGMKWTGRTRTVRGTYTGNGGATQAITGLGFQPDWIFVYPQAGTVAPSVAIKTASDGVNTRNDTSYNADHIISLDADGFTVGDGTGSSNLMNVSARVYVYIAGRND